MRGAVLPAGLLCAALGLTLAFAPPRARMAAVAMLVGASLLATLVPVDPSRVEIVFAGCWISVIALAGTVHLPRLPRWLALGAALDAGLWCGLLVGQVGSRADLLRALPAVAVALPGAWAVRRRWGIAVKVAASWLAAIALLAALLPTVATPGYVPDHMD